MKDREKIIKVIDNMLEVDGDIQLIVCKIENENGLGYPSHTHTQTPQDCLMLAGILHNIQNSLTNEGKDLLKNEKD